MDSTPLNMPLVVEKITFCCAPLHRKTPMKLRKNFKVSSSDRFFVSVKRRLIVDWRLSMPTADPEPFRPGAGTTSKMIEDCRLKIEYLKSASL
jgi:hypothetical protein